MKLLKYFLTFIVFITIPIFSQINDTLIDPGISSYEDILIGENIPPKHEREIIIPTVELEFPYSLEIPWWFYNTISQRDTFMERSTFEHYEWEHVILDDSATHSFFRFPISYPVDIHGNGYALTAYDPNGFVNKYQNMKAVIEKVDSLYNMDDFDTGGDVIIHFITWSNKGNRGMALGGPIFDSKDTTSDGKIIKMKVRIQSWGVNWQNILQVSLHEAGHEYFHFWDTDHAEYTNFQHSSLGCFDVMVAEGFGGYPAPFNPVFRVAKGWVSPTPLTVNNPNLPLSDFQKNKLVYQYQPVTTASNVISDQKFFISYHDFDTRNNPLYSHFPFRNSDLGLILIWHASQDPLATPDSWKDWRKLPIDIECQHGKTVWTETSTNITNTGVPDPLTGRDKLEIRIANGMVIIASPYLHNWVGDSTCVYTPNQNQEFSLFSNPNSNLIINDTTEHYAQSVTTGFTFNNIRVENGQVKANVRLNDYTVTGNKTLTAGKWHFENGLTIAPGATLTINPEAELNFKAGSAINVYGTLLVDQESVLNFLENTSINVNGTLLVNQGSVLNFQNNASILVNGNLTLNSGVKLNLKENSSITINGVFTANQGDTIKFKVGSSIIVNGTISTLGSFEHPVLFDADNATPTAGDWDGLVANPGSTVNFNYSIIKHADYGLRIEDSDYSINNSSFSNNSFGVNIFACTGESVIDNCYFLNNSIAIASTYASPTITNSFLTNNGCAVLCWTGNAYFGSVGQYGNNHFEGNDYDVQTIEGSYAFLGRNTCTLQGGNNSFANSTNTIYHLDAANSSTIIAENNYWGTNPPITSKFNCDNSSSIDYEPYLFAAPSKSIKSITTPEEIQYNTEISTKGSLEGVEQNEKDMFNSEWPLDWQLMYCRNLVMVKKYSKASILLKKIIRDNIDSVQMGFAFNLLRQASKNDQEGLLNYLSNSINGNSEHETLAKIYFADFDKKNAKTTYTNILSNELTSPRNKEYALGSKIVYEFFVENDLGQAVNSFNEFKNQYPKSESLDLFTILLKQSNGNKLRKEGTSEVLTPLEYVLYANYPNPFNPETKIKYCIAKPGFVTLKVYDVLGKEVATLVNDTQKEGEYEISFNAANLATGVYIYSLKSGNFSENKKMLLIK